MKNNLNIMPAHQSLSNDPLFISIAAFMFISLLAIVGFGVKKLISDMENNISKQQEALENRSKEQEESFKEISQKLLKGIDDIKDQVRELKTENQLQSAALLEVQRHVESRFVTLEARLMEKRDQILKLQSRIEYVEKFIETIRHHHNSHHKDDKI